MEKTIEIQLKEHGERIARVIEGWCILLADTESFSVCADCKKLAGIARITK